MKKFKKLLAGLLAGAMMLGSMTATAFADQTTTPATIDTTKTGSLTIHKYEYNGTDESITGTGSEIDPLPTDKPTKELEGAGFTIYKVAGISELEGYYSANPTNDLPKIGTYVENGKIRPEFAKNEVKTETTNSQGLAIFNDLELGFYVVIETTSPDKVTTPADPFLVSIPMTTVDGENWLYDVHVFPKNKTTYGGVTLEKTGNGTDKLSGVIFVLQKQTSEGWTNITTKESDGSALILKTNSEGKINVDGLSQGTYRFIETSRGDNDGYIMDGAATYVFVVGTDGKITYGKNTENNITITVNNEKPDMTKEVQNRSDETWGHKSDYNVGDSVPYRITVSVPSNIVKLKEFNLTDTPRNLKDDTNSIVLKTKGGDTVSSDAYEVDEVGDGFKITFKTDKMSAYAGTDIIVSYSATLLESAVITTAGNPNTAQLEYSNKILPGQDDADNPNKPENPNEEPGKDAIKDNAIVYTFKINIVKKAENAEGKPLADVAFDLYKEVPEGTTDAATSNEVKDAGLDSSKTWKKVAALTTGSDGTVSKSGLANGIYYLVETKTKEGYNLLKEPVKVELNIEYTITTETQYKVVDGVKTVIKNAITETKFENNATQDVGDHTETIINKKGFTLPSTGGMGTVIFSVLGIALVLAGLLVITASRKKAAK